MSIQPIRPTRTLTYSQHAAYRHAAGGETQTEAIAGMADARLNKGGKSHIAFLNRVLDTLYTEACMASTEEQYAPIRAQINRVRAALLKNDAL